MTLFLEASPQSVVTPPSHAQRERIPARLLGGGEGERGGGRPKGSDKLNGRLRKTYTFFFLGCLPTGLFV